MSDEKCRTAAQFGGAAELRLDGEIHRLGAGRETFASQCRGTTRALDVTTGVGHTVGVITDAGIPSAVAADATPGTVVTAIRGYPVAGAAVDAGCLPFADDAFDATACRITAHHFLDPEAFVAEAARILEPGDIFAFEDNVVPEDAALVAFLSGVEMSHDLTHVKLHPVSQWCEWFVATGLSVETVETATMRLQFDLWTGRMNVSPADRDELERRFREAPEEVKELFDAKFDGDSIVSFANPKVLA